MIALYLMMLIAVLAWAVPTLAGIWYLITFREMRDEIRTIRRYLQALHDRAEQAPTRR